MPGQPPNGKWPQSAKKYALWLGIVLIVVAISWAIWRFSLSRIEPNAGQTAAALLALAPTERDWTRGPTEAHVTVVEYSDFQCPACRNFWQATNQLEKDFGGRFRFIYRHFPLDRIHPNARSAAVAAEAAGQQERFWDYYQILYERQSDWKSATRVEVQFERYARELGLDIQRFRKDFNDPSVRKKIMDDLRSGRKSGVESVPAFFVNGRRIDLPKTYADLKRLVGPESK
ncbi:DsbA family protein [Candidatus Parcubacteria bacterium]|nr:DsbA family protein [Candidatus Parcubacteria bacterium]